ncbi:sorbitol-6-phosphate dehydrogenase subunit [Sporolactobacillus sp. CQH2019]|uniref:sorbitol-6-phosphate dehydrogenase subunit n=1 Tax=Sporolactobacillus sp. CQH2019 TaxID=3023512 RepID=UPI002368DAD7|nr:sorbitol-6-phosphate dehydrogenase subunit [Sporolactobacillus sp. CQH2019]MDD9148883.1 sorbitol-6-phosphate dehydrogenase subunit [Sporolactobacillus sp. CQH2019]
MGWIDLGGKYVVITGGSSGIGAQIVRMMQDNGASVTIIDLKENDELTNLKNVDYRHCDITDDRQVTMTFDRIFEEHSKVDALINDAGVNTPKLLVDYYDKEPGHEYTSGDFDFIFNVNVKGAFLCTQAAARQMIRQKHGVVINISSEAGSQGSVGQSIYSATKGAINSFTLSWAKELGRFNIRVVAIEPGINVPTPMGNPEHVKYLAYTRSTNSDTKGTETSYKKIIPLGRVGQLDEIADLVNYLVSDRSSYITGTVINITGGKSHS